MGEELARGEVGARPSFPRMSRMIEVLSRSSTSFTPAVNDARPRVPEPPPVQLVSIRDVRLPVVAGLERELDAFYRDLLRFERVPAPDPAAEANTGPIYRAENHDLRFFVVEVPPERPSCRAIGIVSPHWREIIERLDEQRTPYEFARGLVAASDGVLLQDPTGNWVALFPLREIR